jgi:putative ABC transport system permease protein
MGAWRHDLRSAARQMLRNPGFTVAAVVLLALGIGLNSAVFSLVNATLFRPLPVAAPGELVSIYTAAPGDFMAASALSTADYLDLGERCRSLRGLLAYTYTAFALERAGAESRLVLAVRATPNFFSTLGVRPALGRFFAPGSGREREVVLSGLAWRRRFGADPRVLGTTLRLNGQAFTVVGVAPEEFFGLTRGVMPEVWVPLLLERAGTDPYHGRDNRWLWVLGRRAPGASLATVGSELRAVAARLAEELPGGFAERSFLALPADSVRILPGVDARLGAASGLVLGVVALVLLIASTNVANLFLARALARRREIATRRALGAGPWAVVRQLLTESLVLALLGAVLGLGLAGLSNRALSTLELPLPIDLALGLALDGRVVLFTLAAAVLTALTFGLAPALAAARSDVSSLLREGGPGAGGAGSPVQRRLGGSLVATQVALSLVLLVATGLAVRSLANAHRVDPGFDSRGVLVATFAPKLQGYTHEQTEEFLNRVLTRVRALPGVASAGLASHLPLTVEITFDRVVPAETALPPERWPNVDSARVGPGYFAAMGIPLLRGRGFAESDAAGAPRVAVVNQSFAARFFPSQEAVGRTLRVAGAGDCRVVGVVRDGKYRTLGEAPRPFAFFALEQSRWGGRGHTGEITSGTETLVVRTAGGAPASALAELRRAIREVDARVAVSRLETLEQSLGVALFLPRMAAVVFAVFGLLGLLLAGLGIYGLMVYTVGQRTRELGIRMALGATRAEVLRLVLRRGLGLALAGIGAGLVLAAATTRVLQAVLYGISPTDPATFLAMPLFLLLVALGASLLPARRAAGIDVVQALRDE